jgi:peptidoglycan hydrolase CwlO-like protein
MKRVLAIVLTCCATSAFAQQPYQSEKPSTQDIAAGFSDGLNECLSREVKNLVDSAHQRSKLADAEKEISTLQSQLKDAQAELAKLKPEPTKPAIDPAHK